MNTLLLLCAFVPLFYKHTNALPNGAPIGSCITIRPSVLGSPAVKPRFNRGLTSVLPRFTAVFVRLFLDSTVKACGEATIGGFLI